MCLQHFCNNFFDKIHLQRIRNWLGIGQHGSLKLLVPSLMCVVQEMRLQFSERLYPPHVIDMLSVNYQQYQILFGGRPWYFEV